MVIDTPPHAETDARLAIRGADLVLLPMQPSPADFWASEATLELARRESRAVAVVLNRAPAAGRLKEVVIAGLAARKVPLLAPSFGNRTAFAASFLDGLAVTETAPRSVAAEEARALALAIARRARGG